LVDLITFIGYNGFIKQRELADMKAMPCQCRHILPSKNSDVK